MHVPNIAIDFQNVLKKLTNLRSAGGLCFKNFQKLFDKQCFFLHIDNCKPEFNFPKHFDCCTDEPCNAKNGHGNCCTDDFQCNNGEGDCDQDSHCNNTLGYRCGKNNCPSGFPSDFDCCTKDPKDVCIGTLNKYHEFMPKLYKIWKYSKNCKIFNELFMYK